MLQCKEGEKRRKGDVSVNLIYVDNDVSMLRRVKMICKKKFQLDETKTFSKVRDAVEWMESGHSVNIALLGIDGNMNGLILAQSIKKFHPNVNIIFITALSERECAEELIRLRISGFLAKPWVEETLAEEFRNLRYPVAGFIAKSADAQAEIPQELSRAQMEAVSGGTQHLGIYQSGFQHKDAALAFFRKCVGEETFHRAMNSTEGKRHHYVAARICLNQADWEKFVWIEKYGSLDGFPEH